MENLDCNKIAASVSDVIDGGTVSAEVQAHLDSCASCKLYVQEMRQALSMLRRHAVERSPRALEESIMESISNQLERDNVLSASGLLDRQSRSQRLVPVFAIAAAVIVAFAAGGFLTYLLVHKDDSLAHNSLTEYKKSVEEQKKIEQDRFKEGYTKVSETDWKKVADIICDAAKKAGYQYKDGRLVALETPAQNDIALASAVPPDVRGLLSSLSYGVEHVVGDVALIPIQRKGISKKSTMRSILEISPEAIVVTQTHGMRFKMKNALADPVLVPMGTMLECGNTAVVAVDTVLVDGNSEATFPAVPLFLVPQLAVLGDTGKLSGPLSVLRFINSKYSLAAVNSHLSAAINVIADDAGNIALQKSAFMESFSEIVENPEACGLAVFIGSNLEAVFLYSDHAILQASYEPIMESIAAEVRLRNRGLRIPQRFGKGIDAINKFLGVIGQSRFLEDGSGYDVQYLNERVCRFRKVNGGAYSMIAVPPAPVQTLARDISITGDLAEKVFELINEEFTHDKTFTKLQFIMQIAPLDCDSAVKSICEFLSPAESDDVVITALRAVYENPEPVYEKSVLEVLKKSLPESDRFMAALNAAGKVGSVETIDYLISLYQNEVEMRDALRTKILSVLVDVCTFGKKRACVERAIAFAGELLGTRNIIQLNEIKSHLLRLTGKQIEFPQDLESWYNQNSSRFKPE